MSFPRYPNYKDSGVGWLGEVPAHWTSVRYKNVFYEKSVSGTALPPGSISFGRVIFKDDKLLHEPTKASYQEVLSGEFLINPINLNYDLKSLRTALSDIDTCVSPAYIVLNARVATDKNYLKYQLHVFDLFHMKTLGAGVRQTITFSDIGACFTFLPPIPEQTQIATFLDRETAKIDELVTEQRRLMELLKEKRQAVISHAVTKGLNPDAPMKPSGIEWLGDVPEEWTVIQIRQAAKLESGHTPSRQHPEYWENCTVPWVTLADVWQIRDEKAEYLFDTKEKVSELGLANSSARRLPKDTVILSRTASVGFSGIMGVDMATTQDFANWTCGPRVQPDFLLYVLRAMNGEFRRLMMGSTHNTIYMPDIKSLRFALPSRDQQIEIVEHVRAITRELDALTAEALRAIDLLQERRTALISAAVTGSINIRGFA